MVHKDLRPSGVLGNESRADGAVNNHRSHDTQVCLGINGTQPLGTSSFTMQRPLDDPSLIEAVSNTLTRDGEDMIQMVENPTEEALQVISPCRRTDWTYPHQAGTAPAPIRNAGMAAATHPIISTIPRHSVSSSATTIPLSTEGSSNGSDHGFIHPSSQQGATQDPNPCAEYVVPSKGPMSGGIEVTIVGTNFPHTLPLSVYFSTKIALVVRRKHLARDKPINAERPPDSKDSRNHTMFCSCYIVSWNCRRANSGRTPRFSTRD